MTEILTVFHSTFSDYLVLGNLSISLNLGLQGKEPPGLPLTLFNNHLTNTEDPKRSLQSLSVESRSLTTSFHH